MSIPQHEITLDEARATLNEGLTTNDNIEAEKLDDTISLSQYISDTSINLAPSAYDEQINFSLNHLSGQVERLTTAIKNMATKLDVDAAAETIAVAGSQLDTDYNATLVADLNS